LWRKLATERSRAIQCGAPKQISLTEASIREIAVQIRKRLIACQPIEISRKASTTDRIHDFHPAMVRDRKSAFDSHAPFRNAA
jgi:hypothetical protein